MVNVGEKAPDVELKNVDGKVVKLSTFRGKKVLLSFFPFAFSPVCTDEFGCFMDDMEKFKDRGVQVVGISVDSHWANKAFADSMDVDISLLSDFDKNAAKSFGVLRPEGFSERAYFLIDENGMVRYKHVMAKPSEKLDDEELLKNIR
ncbi:MAG: redoxin domain-containing protein [Candidatus Aenigmarchaeota archaeon]|nr:redoxin domain-containing protein [Candidatus Aenigmarchaeota archaeon]